MTDNVHAHPTLILSPGTQVVTLVEIKAGPGRTLHPEGAVGVIVHSPSDLNHAYRVRFPDGVEESLRQNELIMLAKFKEGEIETVSRRQDVELLDRVILRCVIGSRAYGLNTVDSDIDYRGIYLPPADRHWSLSGVPEQLECHETQETYWEVRKFIVLALKANPNVLECLYSPLVEKATPLAEELLANRDRFLSRLLYQTFNGYVLSQFRKMQADIRNQGQVKWKHVMHLLRLLITGIRALKEGMIAVRVDEHRERLLSIRNGYEPWQRTEEWRRTLHTEFQEAFQTTRLPERPDYDFADTFLVRARRAALKNELP